MRILPKLSSIKKANRPAFSFCLSGVWWDCFSLYWPTYFESIRTNPTFLTSCSLFFEFPVQCPIFGWSWTMRLSPMTPAIIGPCFIFHILSMDRQIYFVVYFGHCCQPNRSFHVCLRKRQHLTVPAARWETRHEGRECYTLTRAAPSANKPIHSFFWRIL